MSGIFIFGGGGFAGSHIAEAAAVRGFPVTCMTRHEIAEQISGVHYRIGSLLEASDRAASVADADALVVAVSPRGDMAGRVRPAVAELADEARQAGVRLIVIGGAGSLLTSDGHTLVKDDPSFPVEAKVEAEEMTGVLDDLRQTPESLDWTLVSPAASFGARNPGEYRGEYRIGADHLLVDENGHSAISGADFGMAVVDEIESHDHARSRFTVSY